MTQEMSVDKDSFSQCLVVKWTPQKTHIYVMLLLVFWLCFGESGSAVSFVKVIKAVPLG